MTKKSRALTRQLERAIETALIGFVMHRASSFVRDLEAIETHIANQRSTDPAHPAALYETFLAGCYQKAEEIDDSRRASTTTAHSRILSEPGVASKEQGLSPSGSTLWRRCGPSIRGPSCPGSRRSPPARVRAEGRRSCSERKHAGLDSADRGSGATAPRREQAHALVIDCQSTTN